MRLSICYALLLMGTAGAVNDGFLDTTFGNDGQLITFFSANGSSQIPRCMVVQPDGKLLVGGRNNQAGGPCGFINRYNQNGTLDRTFGTGGQQIVCFPLATFYAADMILQPDNKILIGVITPQAGNDLIVIARLLPNGRLDTTFGTNGFAQAVSSAGGASRQLLALALQEDGSIVAAGSTSTTNAGIVVRFLSDGTLDTSWGTNGIVMIDPATYGGVFLNLYGIQVQRDNKVVVFGDLSAVMLVHTPSDPIPVNASTPENVFVARFMPDGSFDESFGVGGVSIVSQGTGAAGGVIQNDGKIVAYGSLNTPPFSVVRLLPNGQLDSSFADNGIGTYTQTGNINNMNCMALQSDGKIVAASSFSADNTADALTFTALRLNTDGSIDTTFGQDGYVNTSVLNQPNCQTFACTIDPNGGIYVTGTVGNAKVGVVKYGINSITYGPLSRALATRYYNQMT